MIVLEYISSAIAIIGAAIIIWGVIKGLVTLLLAGIPAASNSSAP